MGWAAVFSQTLVAWMAVVLFVARTSQATCKEQAFAKTCICLNGNCTSQRQCSCENGRDVSEKDLAAELEKMRSTGTSLESVLVSGKSVTSLEPFVGHVEATMSGSLVLEHTSVSSLQPFDVLVNASMIAIIENDALMEISGFERLEHVEELYIQENKVLTSIKGFGNLTKVGSALIIVANPKLKSIPEFSRLTEMGTMRIHASRLTNISGFNKVNTVDSHLQLWFNNDLASLTGFKSLASVGENFELVGNGALVSVTGFKKLTRVDGHLRILQNLELKNISGFQGLANVAGGVTIQKTGLENVDGLRNVANNVSDLKCVDNDALVNVDGFGNLKVVTQDLTLLSNRKLTNVNGLQNMVRVHGNISILSNNGLENIEGFKKIGWVGGNMTIRGNVALENLDGLRNLKYVAGDFTVAKNGYLTNFTGLEKLKEVGGDLVISDNLQDNSFAISIADTGKTFTRRPVLEIRALQSLESVGQHLVLSDIEFGEKTKWNTTNYMPKLKSIKGNLILRRNGFASQSTIMEGLESVGGSLRMVENTVNSNLGIQTFENLTAICANATFVPGCGMEIRGNVGYEGMGCFCKLSVLNGTLSVVDNRDLEIVSNFSKLENVTRRKNESGGIGDLFGGFVVASNPSLVSLEGFDFLTTVRGDLVISDNKALNHIDLGNLSVVTNLTRITANGNLPDFASEEPLPYKESGCRRRNNTVPHYIAGDGHTMLITKLDKGDCDVEILVPTVVGFAIIGAMVFFSMMLFQYMLSNFHSPYHPRRPMAELVTAFAAHLLALADVLSDVGFVITAFILWEDKSATSIEGGETVQENNLPLLAISVLSAVVIVGTQLYMVTAVFWGLNSKKLGSELSSEIPITTLFRYLLGEKAMCWRDWILLFPGLLVFDAEVIKHLPWALELTCNDDKKTSEKKEGFVHEHFARVAFLAGLLEDLPQMALQIAFIIVIEEDDGWAITGAMASLTLSVADVMVKFVFPALIKRISARHLTREVGFKSSVYDYSISSA